LNEVLWRAIILSRPASIRFLRTYSLRQLKTAKTRKGNHDKPSLNERLLQHREAKKSSYRMDFKNGFYYEV
jgi:hypothetical protein